MVLKCQPLILFFLGLRMSNWTHSHGTCVFSLVTDVWDVNRQLLVHTKRTKATGEFPRSLF